MLDGVCNHKRKRFNMSPKFQWLKILQFQSLPKYPEKVPSGEASSPTTTSSSFPGHWRRLKKITLCVHHGYQGLQSTRWNWLWRLYNTKGVKVNIWVRTDRRRYYVLLSSDYDSVNVTNKIGNLGKQEIKADDLKWVHLGSCKSVFFLNLKKMCMFYQLVYMHLELALDLPPLNPWTEWVPEEHHHAWFKKNMNQFHIYKQVVKFHILF